MLITTLTQVFLLCFAAIKLSPPTFLLPTLSMSLLETLPIFRAVFYPATVVSEVLLRKPLNIPRFIGQCYLWPWVNSWIVPPNEPTVVNNGFYIRFCLHDRMGCVLARADIMRGRFYMSALSTAPLPTALPAHNPNPGTASHESGAEADVEASEEVSSHETFASADTEDPTPSHTSDAESVYSISSPTSLQAGAEETDSAPQQNGAGQQQNLSTGTAQDQNSCPEMTAPACISTPPALPILQPDVQKSNCLTPASKLKKRQRVSRRRAILADDALHTDTTEEYTRKKPHLTRTEAIKAMRSHRLDRWLEQQDRSSSTSSVQPTISPTPTTAAWTPVPGFPPEPTSPHPGESSPRATF